MQRGTPITPLQIISNILFPHTAGIKTMLYQIINKYSKNLEFKQQGKGLG
jgi:hypothetical protein